VVFKLVEILPTRNAVHEKLLYVKKIKRPKLSLSKYVTIYTVICAVQQL